MPISYPITSYRSCAIVASLECSVEISASSLQLKYCISGNIEAIKWPAIAPSSGNLAGARTWELWQHTCFECFIGNSKDPAYYEINLSPCGNWNSFHFTNSRENMKEALDLSVTDLVFDQVSANQVELGASLSFSTTTLQPFVDLNLCAVIEDTQDHCHYFALKHPDDRPNFHKRESFVTIQL